MANPFVHVELNTSDPEKAKAFYSKLFQWQLEDAPNPAVPSNTYTMINVGSGTGGGIMKQIRGGPSGWLAYAFCTVGCVFGTGAPYESNSHHRRMLLSVGKRFAATGQAKGVRSAVRKGRARSICVCLDSP